MQATAVFSLILALLSIGSITVNCITNEEAFQKTRLRPFGARNCYFSPVTCLLPHDKNFLRKMITPRQVPERSFDYS